MLVRTAETGLDFYLGFGDRSVEGFFGAGILFFLGPELDCGLQGFGFEAKTVRVDLMPKSNSFKFIF